MLSDNYEKFTEAELRLLEQFVTNTSGHVFVLHNLPEVIMGALFSRYSRSTLGLRTLLLKEFIGNNAEAEFANIVGSGSQSDGSAVLEQTAAIQKAQNFYDRILDGYGDDSIAELGGAHLAIENISMIATKVIEDCRIGGSPLEKSSRYVYFDQKVNGVYQYYREPILMTSAWKDLFIDTCDMLFETYSQLIPPLTAQFERVFPMQEGVAKGAYTAALRAKVLDCLRGLLPASTLTNMGLYGNGRFFEGLIHKMLCSRLTEMQDTGKRIFDELSKVIPSFVRRAGPVHQTHKSYDLFNETLQKELSVVAEQLTTALPQIGSSGVRLVDWDGDAVEKVVAALLFENSQKGLPELKSAVKQFSQEEIAQVLDAACNARENRRHKSPRGLEHAHFTFEVIADYGAYRDLQRHRMLTQERQLLSCQYGYYTPKEIIDTDSEPLYHEAMHKAKQAYDIIATEFPEEAQYVVPLGYNIRWYFHVNLRALQWLCELRSAPAGHPSYRFVAQEMARLVSEQFPQFDRFFKFVDVEGHDMGRIGQEQRRIEKSLEGASKA